MTLPPLQWDRALVVFSGRTDQIWLRLLRRGFRHCFLALGSGGGWLYINPLAHHTDIMVLPVAADFPLSDWYRQQGLTVVEIRPTRPPRRAAPWRPFTCVEAVKRIIGIVDGSILTPWQLYRYINKYGINSLTPSREKR